MVVAGGDDDPAARRGSRAPAPGRWRGTRGRAPRGPRRAAGSSGWPRRRSRSRAGPACPASSSRPAGRRSCRGRSRPARSASRRRASRIDSPASTPRSWAFSRPVSGLITPAPTESSAPIRPSTSIVPASGVKTPAIVRRSVVLPPPLRPTRATASPGPMSRSMSRRPQELVPARRALTRASVGETRRRCLSKRNSTPTPRARTCALILPPASRTAAARGGRAASRAGAGRPRRRSDRGSPRRPGCARRGARSGTTRRSRSAG